MAGLDPSQGGALGAAINAADLQFLETALTLDASAAALQANLNVGDVLAARILPPQGGNDYIEVAGQTFAAQLPPQVYPGDVLALQVTGISGNQIFVRNVGTADPESLPPQPQAQSAPAAARPAQQQQAPAQPVSSALQQTGAPAPPPAPPRAVFVAASVVRAQPQTQAAQTAASVKTPPPAIDARIAAQQNSARASVPAAPAPPAEVRIAGALRAPFVPPVLTNRAAISRTVSDVLRSVKLPDTAFTRTVAAIAQQAPQRLAPVLRRLESVLAQLPSDPRAATLRTIAGFISKLNLANGETLAAQIEAYVSHAVRGSEAKLTSLLQALSDAAASDAASEPSAGRTLPHQAPQPAAQTVPDRHAQIAVREAPPVSNAAAHARAAVLSEASAHDLKTAMLALLRDAPGGRTGTVAQALNESLVTIAGNQLNTLNASAQSPGTIAFALPAFFHEGGKPAYLRISRDGEGSRTPMDADNFHIAFVLDTANLGTVAIDVQTSGRAVNVDVKTEAAPAASAFQDGFGALRERLEHLRYRVSSTAANVLQAKPAAAHAAPAPRTGSGHGGTFGLDAQA